MALKEVRINFTMKNKIRERKLTSELWLPFSYCCDSVMRGRFRSYSGKDVNGVNIVNINFYEAGLINRFSEPQWINQWVRLLNAVQYDVTYNFTTLSGNTLDKLITLTEYAAKLLKSSQYKSLVVLGTDLDTNISNIDYARMIDKSIAYAENMKYRI